MIGRFVKPDNITWEAKGRKLMRIVSLQKDIATKHVAITASNLYDSFLEAVCSLTLDHPAIHRARDARVEVKGREVYLVLEFERLKTLPYRMERREAAKMGLEVLSALTYLHSMGVYHGDLKPANILLGNSAKLIDFGHAGFMDDYEEHGTPMYYPRDTDFDHKTQDLNALRLSVYNLVCGADASLNGRGEIEAHTAKLEVKGFADDLRGLNPNDLSADKLRDVFDKHYTLLPEKSLDSTPLIFKTNHGASEELFLHCCLKEQDCRLRRLARSLLLCVCDMKVDESVLVVAAIVFGKQVVADLGRDDMQVMDLFKKSNADFSPTELAACRFVASQVSECILLDKW